MNPSPFARSSLASSAPGEFLPRAPSPSSSPLNDTAEGIDVLTMLLGLVSLMPISYSPLIFDITEQGGDGRNWCIANERIDYA